MRIPAEWELHRATLVTWPGRRVVWDGFEDLARAEYARLIEQIADDEQVVVIWSGDTGGPFGRPPERLGVTSLVAATDDSWIRDNGPLFVLDENREVYALNFGFNAWGMRFSPFDNDAIVGESVARHFDVRLESNPFVLEGGAVSFNGRGAALVVEECVLHPSRNGATQRDRLERILAAECGVDRVCWLPYGLLEDLANTDGHVDNVAIFSGVNEVLLQEAAPQNGNCDRLRANRRALEAWAESIGFELNVRGIPQLPYLEHEGERIPSSFINLVVTNSSVILPDVGPPVDRQTYRTISEAFKGRDIKSTPARALARGGGGPHCVTMQVPF